MTSTVSLNTPAQNNCCICLDEMKYEKQLIQTPCAHHFHQTCLKAWLAVERICPVCRTNLPPSVCERITARFRQSISSTTNCLRATGRRLQFKIGNLPSPAQKLLAPLYPPHFYRYLLKPLKDDWDSHPQYRMELLAAWALGTAIASSAICFLGSQIEQAFGEA